MTEAAIRVDELSVRFKSGLWGDPVVALDRISLTAARGEIVALLGPNGSGKTTLLRVLAGVQGQDSGSATLLGERPASKKLRLRVGWQPDSPPPLSHLKARDLLAWLGTLQGLAVDTAFSAAERWLVRFGLKPHQHRRARTFSAGMQRRLMLCAALLCDPDVLLLDEPTAALDPEGSLLVLEILREAAARGACVLLASHHLQEVEEICSRAVLLDRGRIRAQGTLDELLGTGEQALIVHGLTASGQAAVAETVRAHGGEVVRTERRHEHLFALFRRLREAE